MPRVAVEEQCIGFGNGKASEIITLIHLAKKFRNLPCSSSLRVIDATFEQGNVWDRGIGEF